MFPAKPNTFAQALFSHQQWCINALILWLRGDVQNRENIFPGIFQFFCRDVAVGYAVAASHDEWESLSLKTRRFLLCRPEF